MHRVLASLLALLLLAACSNQAEKERQNRERYERFAAQQLAEYRQVRGMGRDDLALNFAEDLVKRYPGSAAAREVEAEIAELRAKAEAERERMHLEGLWTYHAVPYEEGEGTIFTGFLYSRGAAGTSPAAEDEPRLRLVIRRHPDWGESVYLLSDAGAWTCAEPCPIRIGFGEGDWIEVAGTPADSGSAPALFIERDFASLLGDLRSSRLLRVEVPLQAGPTVFTFEIGGLDPKRLYP